MIYWRLAMPNSLKIADQKTIFEAMVQKEMVLITLSTKIKEKTN
jgi:hypothetical protein